MASMSSIAIFCPLILTFFFITSSAISFSKVNANGDVANIRVGKQREFDYFILALQWPGTYCQRTTTCCKKNGCCRGENAPLRFTIHGLWPEFNYGGWPSCCTNSHFDIKQISSLRSDLDKYWSTLSCDSPSTCSGQKGTFWGHEWEKHGTCALCVLPNEYEYFRAGLAIYFKYNVTEVLSEAGYVASNSEKYPIGGIISAIQNAFHVTPSIICSNGAIEELRLCFYKNFQPRECTTNNDMVTSRKSCPKYVSLPIYSSSGLKTRATSAQFHSDIEVM